MIAPVFIYDSRERWFPVGVEESLAELDLGLPPETGAPGSINFPNDMEPLPLPPVVYHRVVADQHLWWQQFWVWMLYNPKRYATRGNHEGDWEMVMVGTTDKAGDRPVMLYGSQHTAGGKRELGDWEIRDGRPTIYVALGSHANYFNAFGNLQSRDLDECDGHGRVLDDYEVREFGAWQDWPGRWGNSENSPGPLSTRRIWRQPAIVYGQAR
jgi:hypothetical protein